MRAGLKTLQNEGSSMKLQKTSLALATLALVAALPAGAQTSSVTVQAENMTRSSYVVEGGTRIKLSAATGSASTVFGATGTYDIQVYVIGETDGQPTLDVYRDSTKLYSYLYPRVSGTTSFTIKGVALTKGQTLRLNGRANGDAWARVDRVEFIPVTSASSSTAPATKTIEAESMTRVSYAIENANRIKLTAASGTASAPFGGVNGNYKLQVYVQPETDGRPQLEVYRNGDKVKTFTYPLTTTATTFTIDSVALASTDTIKLVGHANGDAWARVDKIVLTPTTLAPVALEGTTTTTTTTTTACANPSGGYQGFGKNTTGGAGKPVYRVTNLNDSGAGSLRDALSQGNRCVVFDVGGTVTASGNLVVRGANVTIDGSTAPSPGITVKGGGLTISGNSGAGNVVVRGMRIRQAPSDGISVYKASNVVVDQVSVSGFADGAVDVTESSRNVTIQWSIIGAGTTGGNANLVGYGSTRVTSHHNLYIASNDRHPYCGVNDGATSYTADVVCDVRNNLIWDFRVGTSLQDYGKANVVNNYYYSTRAYSSSHGIFNDGTARAFVSGNYSQNGWHINGTTESQAFAADVPSTTDAVTAAKAVLSKAGARGARFGLDTTDQGYVGRISLQ